MSDLNTTTGPVKERASVLQALREARRLGREAFLKQYGYGPAREYVLLDHDEEFDSKPIYGVARKYEEPRLGPLKASEFSGGEATVAEWLRRLGLTVVERRKPRSAGDAAWFVPGESYRRADLHKRFGGQSQGGISTPARHPLIFLVTGQSGELYGYRDGPRPDGTFWYTGEGQVGDMRMVGGNAAIRHHQRAGKALHLFEDTGKGMLRYIAEASYVGDHVEVAPDREGNPRKAIVFELALDSAGEEGTGRTALGDVMLKVPSALKRKSVEELRQLALDTVPKDAPPTQRKTNVYQRSAAVREYVLRRANGVCEACGGKAPFIARDRYPYLEPHHIRRRADGGPDHPRWVAGVCPNCHRRVHSGEDGAAYNEKIAEQIGRLEASP